MRNLFQLRHVLKMGVIWQKFPSDMGCGRCKRTDLDGEGSTRGFAMFLDLRRAIQGKITWRVRLGRMMHHVHIMYTDSVERRGAERGMRPFKA